MHGNLYGPSRPAIPSAVRSVRNVPDTSDQPDAQTGRESWRWFCEAAKDLLGKDAGAQLHIFTGYPERSCYRYASGERAPPADFLRKLFHHPCGAPFFAAFMSGCTAPWWLDMQEKISRGEHVTERDAELAAVTAKYAARIAAKK